MVSSRLVTSSRRAGRVTNKTKLLVVRGTKEADDLGEAEVVVWEDGSTSSVNNQAANGETASQHNHVGAKGVESGELLEHHLQAALSSASLFHSRPSVPSSPSTRQPKGDAATSTTGVTGVTPAAAAAAGSANAALNYHIPTPDATGLIQEVAYAKLYGGTGYQEPNRYIRYSDTVEEAAEGPGGLGYCMDDKDVLWLTNFNSKAEGGSGEQVGSPLKDSKADNSMPPPPTVGRPKREKGKEKEKETPAPVYISEDVFEYIMGVLEKHAEEKVPMLHTDLSTLPTFQSTEYLFSSPAEPAFFPNFEVPRNLPSTTDLVRMAQRVYTHWKDRRTERKGKTIMPTLNYDETNDGDPYVCFRRRDIRATRKTRRTDNFSIERMQKLQVEMRAAHLLCSMVLRRETEKAAQVKAEKEVWEAKWKLYETKRKWPSLGVTKEEEELITGKHSREATMAAAGVVNASMLGPLSAQRENVPPGMRKKFADREREEAEKRRDSRAVDAVRTVERGMGMGAGGRSNAPEQLKERMMAIRQRIDEMMAARKAADATWDDATDNSYQPLHGSRGSFAFRPITELDPSTSLLHARLANSDEQDLPHQPASFRLRRGRGGILRLDRRLPVWSHRRGGEPKSASDLPDWLFPDTEGDRPSRRRPKSIDEVDDQEEESVAASGAKKRKLNEAWRYDVDRGGALGVGMGISEDDDRVVIDDLDIKYARHRITLLTDDDLHKLRPDISQLLAAGATLDAPIELPTIPTFNRPPSLNHPAVAQQMMQQQQIEQFQRYQLLAQQQAIAAQQQAQAAAAQQQTAMAVGMQQQQQPQPPQQAQQQRVASAEAGSNGTSSPAVNGMHPPNGRPPMKRPPSAQNGGPNSMPPPSHIRPSASPNNGMHQSPQLVNSVPMPQQANGQLPPGQKQFLQQGNIDPQLQQRILSARAMQVAQQQVSAQAQAQMNGQMPMMGPPGGMPDLSPEEQIKLAQQAGYGENVAGFVEARRKAQIITAARMQPPQQQQQNGNGTANGNGNGNGNANGGGNGGGQYPSPQLPSGGLQLKLPPHAAARLGASTQQPQRV